MIPQLEATPPTDPLRVLDGLLRAGGPIETLAAVTIMRLLVERQDLLVDQLAAEMRYEAQLSGWNDIAYSMHSMIKRLSKAIPDERLANAARTMEDIRKRMSM